MPNADGMIAADMDALNAMRLRLDTLAESMQQAAEDVKKLPLGQQYSSQHARGTDGPCQAQMRDLNRALSATARNMAGVMRATKKYLICVKEDLETADAPETGG